MTSLSERLGLELIGELAQLVEVDTGPETEGVGDGLGNVPGSTRVASGALL